MSKCSLLLLGSLLSAAAMASEPADATIAEGRRLVHQVGLCIDCHSPRNPDGSYDSARTLQGSPLPFAPTVPMPWAPFAPNIAGLPNMTDEQAVIFLTTGVRPDGSRPLPPMPEFRFSKNEAAAVVAYLRTLPPAPTVVAVK